jgi:hypothetical protein
MNKPYYRLEELIKEKYGETNYATGCDIVARGLNHDSKVKIGGIDIAHISRITDDLDSLTINQLIKLKQLFTLSSFQELFNPPIKPQLAQQLENLYE